MDQLGVNLVARLWHVSAMPIQQIGHRLITLEKRIGDQMCRRHEIEPGSPVIIKEKTEHFVAYLNPFGQPID